MNIIGLQKLTLLDYPEHLACTLFTGGCNFRCPFCHNASLVLHPEHAVSYSEEDILTYLKSRQGILEGVCISGGEPTLQPDLKEFIKKVKELGFLVKLDTNGTKPDLLKELCSEQLIDYVSIDVKNSKEHYAKTIGLDTYDITPINETIEFLIHGTLPYEFRTTVVRELHTPEDILSMGKWLQGCSRYYLQGFVDSGDLIQSGLSAYTKDEMLRFANDLASFTPNVAVRGIE